MNKPSERTFEVTITKTVTVRMSDEALSHEALREFGQTIFEVGGPDELMEHVARQVAQHDDHFVEGVGPASAWDDKAPVRYSVTDIYVTAKETP